MPFRSRRVVSCRATTRGRRQRQRRGGEWCAEAVRASEGRACAKGYRVNPARCRATDRTIQIRETAFRSFARGAPFHPSASGSPWSWSYRAPAVHGSRCSRSGRCSDCDRRPGAPGCACPVCTLCVAAEAPAATWPARLPNGTPDPTASPRKVAGRRRANCSRAVARSRGLRSSGQSATLSMAQAACSTGSEAFPPGGRSLSIQANSSPIRRMLATAFRCPMAAFTFVPRSNSSSKREVCFPASRFRYVARPGAYSPILSLS